MTSSSCALARRASAATRSIALLLACVAPSAHAQYQGSGDVTYRYSDSVASTLTVGPASIDASFFPVDTLGVERSGIGVDGSGFGIRLANSESSLTAAYGSSDGGGEALLVDVSFGPSITPYSRSEAVWVGVHIPVRFDIGYQYLAPPSDEALPDDDTLPYHVGRIGAGLGLAADGGVLLDGFASEVSGRVSLVFTPGVMTEFTGGPAASGGPFDTVYAQRSSEFDIEIRAARLGGSGVGAAVGFTVQSTRWDPDTIETLRSVADAVTADGFVRNRRVGLLRFGLAF